MEQLVIKRKYGSVRNSFKTSEEFSFKSSPIIPLFLSATSFFMHLTEKA